MEIDIEKDKRIEKLKEELHTSKQMNCDNITGRNCRDCVISYFENKAKEEK